MPVPSQSIVISVPGKFLREKVALSGGTVSRDFASNVASDVADGLRATNICHVTSSSRNPQILGATTPAATSLNTLCKVTNINLKLVPFLSSIISSAPQQNSYEGSDSSLLEAGVRAFVEVVADRINNNVSNKLTDEALTSLKTQLTTYYNGATVAQKLELYQKFYVEADGITNSSTPYITTSAPFHLSTELTQEQRLTAALYTTGLPAVTAEKTAELMKNTTSTPVLESIARILSGTHTSEDVTTWRNTSTETQLAIIKTIGNNTPTSNPTMDTSSTQKIAADGTLWDTPSSTSKPDWTSSAYNTVSNTLTLLASLAGLTSANIMTSELQSPMKDLVAFNITNTTPTNYLTTSAPFGHTPFIRTTSSENPFNKTTSINILSDIQEVRIENQGGYNDGMEQIKKNIAQLASLFNAQNPYAHLNNIELSERLKKEFKWADKNGVFQYTAFNQALENEITRLQQSASHGPIDRQTNLTSSQASSDTSRVQSTPWLNLSTSKLAVVAATALQASSNASNASNASSLFSNASQIEAGNGPEWTPGEIAGFVTLGLLALAVPVVVCNMRNFNRVGHAAAQTQALSELNQKAATNDFDPNEWANLIKDAGYQTVVRELQNPQAQNGAEQAQAFLRYLAQNQEKLDNIIIALDTLPPPAGNGAAGAAGNGAAGAAGNGNDQPVGNHLTVNLMFSHVGQGQGQGQGQDPAAQG